MTEQHSNSIHELLEYCLLTFKEPWCTSGSYTKYLNRNSYFIESITYIKSILLISSCVVLKEASLRYYHKYEYIHTCIDSLCYNWINVNVVIHCDDFNFKTKDFRKYPKSLLCFYCFVWPTRQAVWEYWTPPHPSSNSSPTRLGRDWKFCVRDIFYTLTKTEEQQTEYFGSNMRILLAKSRKAM